MEEYGRGMPEVAARALVALNALLAGVEASPWSEVAWCFSHLTGDGFPVELAFTSNGEAIRYVSEVAGPEVDATRRFDLALVALGRLGIAPPPDAVCERLRRVQRIGRLGYGAWVGGRHGVKGDTFKLYVEVPRLDPKATGDASERGVAPGDDTCDLVQALLGDGPLLTRRAARLRMIGCELSTGRKELYFRADGLEPWEVARLLGLAGMSAQQGDLIGLIEEVSGRPAFQQLPSHQTGFSLSVVPDGGPMVLAIFCLARTVLGGDGRIRERLLEVGARRGWPLRHYAAISKPLAGRTGPRTRHGILSFVAAPKIEPIVHIGLRPPEGNEATEGTHAAL
jgi:hypothetical protein